MLDSIFNNEWMTLIALCVSLFGFAELGYRIGLGLHRTKDDARRSQIGGVQGAALGLLGLLLGFTFSMAANRYDTRREMVLKEANSIGTTWLRADLLPEGHRMAVKALLRDYVDVRIQYGAQSRDPAMLAEGLRRSADLETQLWSRATAAAAYAPTPITATFISALNDMIDTDSERIAAMRNKIPSGVWILLTVVASFGCFVSTYGSGAQGARSAFTSLLLPALIIVVVMLIFDLAHSRQGLIGVSQQPMLDLKASISTPPSK